MDANKTVEEVSKELKVSKRTVLREIKRGNIEARKVGKRYLISSETLEDYLGGSVADVNKQISKYLSSKKGEMVDLLQKMVSMQSVGYKSNQEHEFADFISKELNRLGIRNSVLREGDAIAVRASYGYADEGILFDCPLDTAPVGNIDNWNYPPFGGVIKGGRIYGRGTADCKAGIVAGIYCLLALKKFINEDKLRIELVYDGGEQDGSYLGMEMVIKRGLYVSAGIIGYADKDFNLYLGCRGYHRYTFTAKGKSAHTGSRSRPGINAIEKMAKFIHEMKKLPLGKSKIKRFDFGQKMAFALISGGDEINVVPDECTARLDFRTTPDFDKDYVDGLIAKKINELSGKDKDFIMDWKYDLGNEGYSIDENQNIVPVLRESISDVYSKKVELDVTGPSNIGSILAREGIPAVLWGPRGGNVHSYDEYVEIDSLSKTAEVYAQTAMKYFGIK